MRRIEVCNFLSIYLCHFFHVVSSCRKKQTYVALSTMEAKFIVKSLVMQECVRTRRFIKHLGVMSDARVPIELYYDNQTIISFKKISKFHSNTKHIDTCCKYMKDMVKRGKISLNYISTHNMMVDLLTKPITTDAFRKHVIAMGLNKKLSFSFIIVQFFLLDSSRSFTLTNGFPLTQREVASIEEMMKHKGI